MRGPPRRIQSFPQFGLAILDPKPIVNQVSPRHLSIPDRCVYPDQFENSVYRRDDLTSNIVFGIRQDVSESSPDDLI